MKNTFSIGLTIDGSSESSDYIKKETIKFAQTHGFKAEMPKEFIFVMEWEENADYSQELSELADCVIDFLNQHEELPSYCSFFFEDNSLFLAPNVEDAKESVDFVSSRKQDCPEDDFEGEWLHVSDHGNATLYVRKDGKDEEIWGIVWLTLDG